MCQVAEDGNKPVIIKKRRPKKGIVCSFAGWKKGGTAKSSIRPFVDEWIFLLAGDFGLEKIVQARMKAVKYDKERSRLNGTTTNHIAKKV